MPNFPQKKEQQKVYIINALKVAHTDLHRALTQLENNGSEQSAKNSTLSALKKIGEALAQL